MPFMEPQRFGRRLGQLPNLNLCAMATPICFEHTLTHRNILATNQVARRTIEPFENNNKRSRGRLGEGGSLGN